jgi:DNA-binding Lrp family transcriptional regulator
MPRALVFINTRSDASELVKALAKVNGVSEAHSSRGVYDAVAVVQAGSLSQVKEIVSKGIRSFDDVKSTLTLTLIEPSVT